jgi:hypothetical protein
MVHLARKIRSAAAVASRGLQDAIVARFSTDYERRVRRRKAKPMSARPKSGSAEAGVPDGPATLQPE